jgi:hypothetical protein
MTERSYRWTVLASAVVWFMLGLHAPMIVHPLTHHDRTPDTTVVVIEAMLGLAAIVCLFALLRGGGGGAAARE